MAPFSTWTGKVPVQPSSGPVAPPDARSITQLCSGQVTRAPWTMPCDSGPPAWGQRSRIAKTSSSAVRKMAMSPRGVWTTRAPAGGMSVTRPTSIQARSSRVGSV